MFNQRPTTLLGLEPRTDGQQDLINFLSPIITTPDQYLKYFDFFMTRDRINESLNTPTANISTDRMMGQFEEALHHQQQQQNLTTVMQQPQYLSHPPQLTQPPHPPQALHSQHHHQQVHQQQPQQHHQQQQQPQQQNLTPPIQQPPQQQIPTPPSQQPLQQQQQQQEAQQTLSPLLQVHQIKTETNDSPLIKTSITPVGSGLEVDEKLRRKRERNRKAAANCRRRKDEKVKRLEEENASLRKTIESLQMALATARQHTSMSQ